MGRAARWVAPAALTATGVGLGVLAQVLAETQSGRPASWTVPDLVGGWVFLAAGLLVWRQRPSNRCWWLLMASGVTWFVGTFAAAADDDLSLTGFAFAGWTDVFLLWLVLAYPTGRLAGRVERVVLGLVTAMFAARTLAKLFLYVPPDGTGCECVPNRFLPLTDRRWYDAVDAVWPWVLSVAFVAVLGATVRRWRRSSRPGREVLAPTVATVSLVTAQLLFTYVVRRQAAITVPTSTDLFYVVVLLRVAAATAFVVGLRQLYRTRSAVVDLVGELSEQDPTPSGSRTPSAGRSATPPSSCARGTAGPGTPPRRAPAGRTP